MIFEARKALRNTIFADKPIAVDLSLHLKGRAAAEYLLANPLPDLKTKPSKKAKAVTAPKSEDILTPPPEEAEDET